MFLPLKEEAKIFFWHPTEALFLSLLKSSSALLFLPFYNLGHGADEKIVGLFPIRRSDCGD